MSNSTSIRYGESTTHVETPALARSTVDVSTLNNPPTTTCLPPPLGDPSRHLTYTSHKQAITLTAPLSTLGSIRPDERVEIMIDVKEDCLARKDTKLYFNLLGTCAICEYQIQWNAIFSTQFQVRESASSIFSLIQPPGIEHDQAETYRLLASFHVPQPMGCFCRRPEEDLLAAKMPPTGDSVNEHFLSPSNKKKKKGEIICTDGIVLIRVRFSSCLTSREKSIHPRSSVVKAHQENIRPRSRSPLLESLAASGSRPTFPLVSIIGRLRSVWWYEALAWSRTHFRVFKNKWMKIERSLDLSQPCFLFYFVFLVLMENWPAPQASKIYDVDQYHSSIPKFGRSFEKVRKDDSSQFGLEKIRTWKINGTGKSLTKRST